MTTIETLLQRNKAISHTPLPYFSELKESGSPGLHTIIVTCLDPRCVPETFFNLAAGEVGVHRNAGGNIRDALRDISILDSLFSLKEICIIHHTDCGTTHVTEESVRSYMKEYVGKEHWAEVDKMAVWPVTDIEASVRGDLEWVQKTPFIREELKKGTQGFVFDIKTGSLTKVNP
ncbi:carbonic anhydrase [Thelonectria olida]|uniref:Carbonic anhydrase n=1 Tax=Thelonectria olida TaxID=1576542 RepID=A0A9P9AMW4_9HYPO|nr:carbonic anhydrase [Thelonectria olida]